MEIENGRSPTKDSIEAAAYPIPQIVVTSEMRRAGALALEFCRGAYSDEEIAEAVYNAMVSCVSDQSSI